jgi:MFS family permease
VRRLLAHREARLYLTGQILSTFGDSALVLAMGIWVKVLTGSTGAAGLVFSAQAAGFLFGPLGGVLADRVRRRPVLIAANLATAGLVLLLLLVRGRHEVWLIYAVAFGYGLSFSVLGPAQSALVQAIIPADLLGEANGALQTAEHGFRLLTPLLGAGLFAAFGAGPVIIGDAVTFLVAVATLLAIQVSEAPAVPSQEHWSRQLTEGARHIAATPVLRQLVVATVLAVIAFGLSETVSFAVVSQGLHRSPTFLGVLVSAQGAGAIAAGATAAAAMRRLSETTLAGLGMASSGTGFLLLTVPWLPVVLTGSVLLGAGLPWIIVGVFTLLQRRTPPALMGRTDAAFGAMYTLPQTLAIALGAGLIAVLSYKVVLLVITALMASATVYMLTRHETENELVAVPDENATIVAAET